MKDVLFVVCLALLAFGTVNLIFSVAILAGVRTLGFDCPPRVRARRYLLVRAFPGTVSLLFVVTIFLPILCRHEPGSEDERLGLAMAVLALAAASIMVAAAVRGLHGIWATRRLSKSWGFGARALDIDFPIPAFIIEAPFPVVAIVGIRRRRLYVARQVLEDVLRMSSRRSWHMSAPTFGMVITSRGFFCSVFRTCSYSLRRPGNWSGVGQRPLKRRRMMKW